MNRDEVYSMLKEMGMLVPRLQGKDRDMEMSIQSHRRNKYRNCLHDQTVKDMPETSVEYNLMTKSMRKLRDALELFPEFGG